MMTTSSSSSSPGDFVQSCQFFFVDKEDFSMNIHIALQPFLALVAGILILVMPKFLNYIVAAYLIIYGLMGIMK